MTDKQISGGRGSAKPYTTLNTIVVMLENEKLKEVLKAKEQECEELNKWLPIVTRLEEQFKCHEKAKSIGYKTYAEQVFTELDQLKAENEDYQERLEKIYNFNKKVIDEKFKINCQNTRYKQALTEIKQLLEDALDSDKTSAEQSFDNLYEALEKCEVLDEDSN